MVPGHLRVLPEGAALPVFASAFSVEGVEFLETLDTPAHKIASPELGDHALFHAAIKTLKPVIMSTGMATDHLVGMRAAYRYPILLHCVSEYPATIESANLSAIKTLQKYAPDRVGLSDHTPGIETAIAATALGAVMIEKHFKLDDDCIDAAFSLDPAQFAAMCRAVRAVHQGMGDGILRPTCKPRQK
jgi:sialic acid synthase SpsE